MLYKTKEKFRNASHDSIIIKKLYTKANYLKSNLSKVISDELFAKIKYKENTGKNLNLNHPILFNEKLWWLMINNRNSLMTECTDKVKVRDYIKNLNLGHILTDIQGVYDHVEDIPFNELKGKFFIKCNHVSGINAIYDSSHSEKFNYEVFKKEFNSALKINYYYQNREWNYKNIVPKILVERFIEAENNLLDYRFFCFHGEVKLIFIDIDTASDDGKHNPKARRNIYDRNFVLQDFNVGRINFDSKLVEKPENLEQMIEIAEMLSTPFPFCRIDLYNNDNKIKFGEITFYPGGATQQFSNLEADLMVSSWLKIP